MIKKIKNIILISLLTIGAVTLMQTASPSYASAALFDGSKQAACDGTQLGGGGGCGNGSGNRLSGLIKSIINILSIIIGVAAVIMIIINGFRLITSNGDANSVSGAKKGIIYALVGLVIVALAQVIVWIVLKATNDVLKPTP